MKKNKIVASIIKKRIRKKISSSEFYKTEMPEHFEAFVQASKSTVTLSFVLIIILKELSIPSNNIFMIFGAFLFGFLFWKICERALISWKRLNKLHRVIEEEKFEIEHHRENERKELETLYKAKGFEGELLNDVVDVLMADDNRLLQVMMEEEMGLTLRRYEHPLKQGVFSALGVFLAGLTLFLGLYYGTSFYEFFLLGAFITILTSISYFKKERIDLSFVIIWNIAILAFVSISTFLAINFIKS